MESSATRNRKQHNKEKITNISQLTSEEKTELHSFLISLVVHTFVLLFLAIFSTTEDVVKPIKISMSFDSSSDQIGSESMISLEETTLSVTNIELDSEHPSENIKNVIEHIINNQNLIVEPLSVEIHTKQTTNSILDDFQNKDLLSEMESTKTSSDTTQAINDEQNVLGKLILATSTGVAEQRRQSKEFLYKQRQNRGSSNRNSSIEQRLSKAGAKTGDVQISIAWDTIDDIDLHVTYTSGNALFDMINFMNRVGQSTGGMLDVDMNANNTFLTNAPVENVFWPQNKTPNGYFTVYIHFYRSWTSNSSVETRIRVKYGDKILNQTMTAILGRSPQQVLTFTFPENINKPEF